MNVFKSSLSAVGGQESPPSSRQRLDDSFKAELEGRINGWLGKPGTERRARIEEAVSALLTEPDLNGVRKVAVDNLSETKMNELVKLQKASQDFEAIFVKGLLAQMRRSSLAEESTPMADLAKDMMDQAVAESVSRSNGSIGIAKTIFVDMAQRIVRATDTNELNKQEN